MHGLDRAIESCMGCGQGWHLKNSIKSWYGDYANWVSVGFCTRVTPALIPGQKIVVPEAEFYACLAEWLSSNTG